MYLFVIGVLILIVLFVVYKLKKYEVLDQLPGPSSLEALRFFTLSQTSEEIFYYLTSLQERYGSIIKIWIKPFKPILLIAHPTYFEHILTSKDHVNKTQMYDMFYLLGGNGLASNKNIAQWKSDRKLLNSIFNNKDVADFTSKFKNHADKLDIVLKSKVNQPIDVHHILQQTTLSIILDYLTNESLDEETSKKYIQAIDTVLRLTIERPFSIFKSNDWIYKFTKDYKSVKKAASYIDKITSDILKRQIQSRRNQKDTKEDFMNIITEGNYSEESQISQLKTFIVAGYDTVATTISFALFELAKRPDIQEKILKENLEILNEKDESEIDFADIQLMNYTELVLKESMRLYSAIPMIQRTIKETVNVDGITIPSDVDIIFAISSLHRFHFDRPHDFDPDRFSLENLKDIIPYAYAPFSLGPRNCIGRRLAMVEMKYILSYIIRHFTLHALEPKHQLDLAGDFALRSRNGIPVIFKRR